MRQLVGMDCRLCNKRISSELDARFCEACTCPIHDACAVRTGAPQAGVCSTCGVPHGQEYAAAEAAGEEAKRQEERDRRLEQRRREDAGQPNIEGKFPVGRACPNCKGESFRSVRPKSFVAFGWDRVCKGCGTRYTPPTPRWGGFAFILVGLPLAGVGGLGAIAAVAHLARGELGNLSGAVCSGSMGMIGVLSIIHGMRTLIAPGKV